MLKKKLGIEGIEKDHSWNSIHVTALKFIYKIPSTLVIPRDCKKIGNNAFVNCRELEEVVISEGVKSIGTCSFQGCWGLKKVIIPGSVEEIGDYAFYSCESADVLIMTSERKFRSLGRLALNDCLTVSYVKEETRN